MAYRYIVHPKSSMSSQHLVSEWKLTGVSCTGIDQFQYFQKWPDIDVFIDIDIDIDIDNRWASEWKLTGVSWTGIDPGSGEVTSFIFWSSFSSCLGNCPIISTII